MPNILASDYKMQKSSCDDNGIFVRKEPVLENEGVHRDHKNLVSSVMAS